MLVQSTIYCECGCIFESEFQESSYDNPPVCPQCKQVMDSDSWKALHNIMGDLNDFNTHIVKWHSERNEPLMQVPAITVRTLKD